MIIRWGVTETHLAEIPLTEISLPLRRLPERCVDSRLPAGAGGAEMGQHVGVQSNADRFFGHVLLRPTDLRSTNEAVALANLRPLEPVAIKGRGVVRIDPFARASALLRRHARTSWR